jgi:hypothetical protein
MSHLFSITLRDSPSYAVENVTNGRNPISEAKQKIKSLGFLMLLSNRILFLCSENRFRRQTDFQAREGISQVSGDLERSRGIKLNGNKY